MDPAVRIDISWIPKLVRGQSLSFCKFNKETMKHTSFLQQCRTASKGSPTSTQISKVLARKFLMPWVQKQLPWSLPIVGPCRHHSNVTINSTIGLFAAGCQRWNADWEHSRLRKHVLTMSHCLQLQPFRVTYSHVKAHQGHPMNELADALAKATAKQCVPLLVIPAYISTVFQNRQFHHAWMTMMNPADVPLPAAMRGAFKAEGPFGQQQEDCTWNPGQTETHQEHVQLFLSLASANVLTLDPGAKTKQQAGLLQIGRIATLQAQFDLTSHNLMGIQEARTQGQHARHSQTHLVFQSGATDSGARGCELWVSRTKPYATSQNNEFRFQAQYFHIASYSDRHIFAVIRAPRLDLRVLVVHAPDQQAQDIDYEEWWTQMQRLVSSACTQYPIVILGDMNARLGSVTSQAVENYSAEPESKTGHMMHSFLLETNLWAPATFPECHSGPSATWTSHEGQHHRLDYVCIPFQWRAFDVSSYVQQEVDLCTVKDDHQVVALDIRMYRPKSTHQRVKHTRIDVRKCIQPAAMQKFKEYLQQTPHIPWNIGVGEHAETLTAWLQQGAQQCFSRDKELPRQRYMSEFTWSIVQIRKQLHQQCHRYSQQASKLWLRQVFLLWRRQVTQHPEVNQQIDQILSQLQLFRVKCMQQCAWSSHHRMKLHTAARHASKHDRVTCAQNIAEQFFTAAQSQDPKRLYRSLKPLLGQAHRRAIQPFRPIPAVRNERNQLTEDHTQAATCWQTYFAKPEQGIAVSSEQLQTLVQLQAPRYAANSVPFDLQCVPQLDEIQHYIQTAKANKSPGVDGLPSEIYKVDAAQMARLLWPLMAKCSLRCTEPVRWRGGEIDVQVDFTCRFFLQNQPWPGPKTFDAITPDLQGQFTSRWLARLRYRHAAPCCTELCPAFSAACHE